MEPQGRLHPSGECRLSQVEQDVNKEQIYDAQIFPLMAQILDICKEHKIAMVAAFHTPNDEDAELFCSSRVPGENGEYPAYLKDLSAIVSRNIRGESAHLVMIESTDNDGVKTMTAVIG